MTQPLDLTHEMPFPPIDWQEQTQNWQEQDMRYHDWTDTLRINPLNKPRRITIVSATPQQKRIRRALSERQEQRTVQNEIREVWE